MVYIWILCWTTSKTTCQPNQATWNVDGAKLVCAWKTFRIGNAIFNILNICRLMLIERTQKPTYQYRLQSNLHKQIRHMNMPATLSPSVLPKTDSFHYEIKLYAKVLVYELNLIILNHSQLSSPDFGTLWATFFWRGDLLCILRKCPLPSYLRVVMAKALTTMTFAMAAAIILTFFVGPQTSLTHGQNMAIHLWFLKNVWVIFRVFKCIGCS